MKGLYRYLNILDQIPRTSRTALVFPEGTYGIMKNVSPPRTFNLLLEFVEAQCPYTWVLEYTAIPLDIIIFLARAG